MSAVDSRQGEVMHTPRRVQKCLFGPSGSANKKSPRKNGRCCSSSEEESDLGHISPLAMTDRSPTSSSCGSPKSWLASPPLASSPKSSHRGRRNHSSSFNALRKVSRQTRHSPRPRKSKTISDTPSRWQFVGELQDDITASGGGAKGTLKRQRTSDDSYRSKLFKIDENCSVSTARTALFQTNREFSLSTESFYHRRTQHEEQPPCSAKGTKSGSESTGQLERRKSYPSYGGGGGGGSSGPGPYPQTGNGRVGRRNKVPRQGLINAGVSHGIVKRPASKRQPKSSSPRAKDSDGSSKEKPTEVLEGRQQSSTTREGSSPEIDPKKRFFKIKRTGWPADRLLATTREKKSRSDRSGSNNKRQKILDISFDTTDLSVDEPEIEASLEKCAVANILKVLGDDWADDDYDTMGSLLGVDRGSNPIESLIKSTRNSSSSNLTMSPASELSTMTSKLNIEDKIAVAATGEPSLLVETRDAPERSYYPLFVKGAYSIRKGLDEKVNHSKGSNGARAKVSLKRRGLGEDQYQLDAGQRLFGARQCTECGVVYQIGDPEDEKAHLLHHEGRKILKFPGWKNERVVVEDASASSRIILVEPGDSKQNWNKVDEILGMVDKDLGLVDATFSNYHSMKVYLYIKEKTVLGVLVAESIKSAHRMIPEFLDLNCCTAESSPAKCGINVIWTILSHRRQGIATKLVNTLRTRFYYGYVMSMDDIAFSNPTPSGKIFAEKYTKTRNFQVYN